MADLMRDVCFESIYQNRSVLVTGHTGFKGSWLTTWLKLLGARVIGFSLPPQVDRPNLFNIATVGQNIVSILGDVRDLDSLTAALQTHEPEFVFHLAAQPLVRRSYVDPCETFATNIMGTVHLLEAVRQTPSVRVVVIVTSDKCYENRGAWAYRENDSMGGHDPYSASKGAAELVTASYRKSFFHPDHIEQHHVSLSSVRAGNVIGGGDWAKDRLIPDCIESLNAGEPIIVRNPGSVRPWQHVLEPLAGYLWLACRMRQDPISYANAWNFGPSLDENHSVCDMVRQVVEDWGSGYWRHVSESSAPHEDISLKLDSSKALDLLRWKTVLSVRETLNKTVTWYRAYYKDPRFDGHVFAARDIADYTATARQTGMPWAM